MASEVPAAGAVGVRGGDMNKFSCLRRSPVGQVLTGLKAEEVFPLWWSNEADSELLSLLPEDRSQQQPGSKLVNRLCPQGLNVHPSRLTG